jgi:hypothetical protein
MATARSANADCLNAGYLSVVDRARRKPNAVYHLHSVIIQAHSYAKETCHHKAQDPD